MPALRRKVAGGILTQEQGGAVQSAEEFAESMAVDRWGLVSNAMDLIRERDAAIRRAAFRESALRLRMLLGEVAEETDYWRGWADASVAVQRSLEILAASGPPSDDALRTALKEIIALEDRGVGVTLANDKLRQAQAIAQNALAASGPTSEQ